MCSAARREGAVYGSDKNQEVIMKRKTTGAFAVLGSALALTVVMTAPVHAETVTNEESVRVIDTAAWQNMAAANVTSYANIREGASVDSGRIGVLLPGCSAEVLGTEGDWTKVRSGSVEGYIRSDLLVFGEEARVHYRNVHGFSGTVTADALNVRSAPSLEGSVLGSEAGGEEVKITGEENEWLQIEYQGNDAYMAAEYIETKDLEHTALTLEEYEQMRAAEEAAQAAAAQAAQSAEAQVAATSEAQPVSAGSAELDLLAAIIHCEAGGESRTGKVAVGAVVLNRVNSGAFPNSISEVIYQSGQFTPASSGILARTLAQGADADCYEAARAALNGENPVGGCLYFNSGSGQGIQIGNQHFY